jgi:hypothetical protein
MLINHTLEVSRIEPADEHLNVRNIREIICPGTTCLMPTLIIFEISLQYLDRRGTLYAKDTHIYSYRCNKLWIQHNDFMRVKVSVIYQHFILIHFGFIYGVHSLIE